tara:strand:+ start:12862 stop:14295 length:1434 start_codon:yes stop_codon:yes gene_type:complete
MYIPTQFYGKLDSCISASGGDSVGEFISGSQIWKYHKYTTLGSGSFTIHTGSSSDAILFLVAGGGGGGSTTEGGGGSPQGAGGGGAGGVVYTQYRLGPGTSTLYVGDGGQERVSGENSWIEVEYFPSDYDYYAPTGSRLTADGGGRGGYFSFDGAGGVVNAENGGSGGGLARGLVTGPGYVNTAKGNGRDPQGFSGGAYDDTYGSSFEGGAGGGGASEQAEDINGQFAADKNSRGGNGVQYMVDGVNRYYAGGGGGLGEGNLWPTTTSLGSSTFGGGGSGSNSGAGGNPGTIGGHDLRDGREGIIVIMYPVCPIDLNECTEYSVDGGANGGNITFVPCGGTEVETITLDPLDEIAICAFPITAPISYPSSSGDVTFASVGTCDIYVEPPNPPSCGGGETLQPLYLTEMVVDAPAVGPYPGFVSFTWLDYLGDSQSNSWGTGTWTVCAQSGSVSVTGQTVGGTAVITHTATQCGYYCA